MKNVVAYSLWGEKAIYWTGALKNIDLVKKYFPEYVCQFYIDRKCRKDLISTLENKDCEIIMVDDDSSWGGMFWRFRSAADPNVDIFLSRDCDSRFSDREVAAIKEWLASDKDFHIMRDHIYHTVAILGGMWGCRNGILRNIDLIEKIKKWNFFSRKGCDQDFLGQVIYPIVKDRSFEHCDFPNLNFGGKLHPFPTKRQNYEYVGDIFDENDVRHPDYWKLLR